VHVDLGAGDGAYAYRLARRTPGDLFIAVDANADALATAARHAARKTSRGGVSNLICIAGPAEELSGVLPGLADRITVLLPWSRLLRAVAEPLTQDLLRLAAIGRPGAEIETVFSYAPAIDGHAAAHPGVVLDERHVRGTLPAAWRAAGLEVTGVDAITRDALKAYPTTWAGRLAFGRDRTFWRLRARVAPQAARRSI
jgi:hypothetical protein